MRILLTSAAIAMSLSGASIAYAASESNEAADSGQRVICKEQRKTGTRFTTKTCRTAAQWNKMAEEHRAAAKDMVDRPKILACGPNGCGG
jgi:hypothetical protein